jgi:hypothetical protein
VHSDLRQLVEERLKAKELSMRGFAEEVGLTSSFVSKVVRGVKALPLKRVPEWETALGLRGQAAAEFRELVLIGHCPGQVKKVLLAMRAHPDWPGIDL